MQDYNKLIRKNKYSMQVAQSLLNEHSLKKYQGILINDKNGLDLLLMGNDEVNSFIYDNLQWELHLQNALRQLVKPKDKVLVVRAL